MEFLFNLIYLFRYSVNLLFPILQPISVRINNPCNIKFHRPPNYNNYAPTFYYLSLGAVFSNCIPLHQHLPRKFVHLVAPLALTMLHDAPSPKEIKEHYNLLAMYKCNGTYLNTYVSTLDYLMLRNSYIISIPQRYQYNCKLPCTRPIKHMVVVLIECIKQSRMLFIHITRWMYGTQSILKIAIDNPPYPQEYQHHGLGLKRVSRS